MSLGADAVADLRRWRQQQDGERDLIGPAYGDEGWVITYPDGRPLRPAHVSRVFDTLVARHGMTGLRLLGLRHAHGSLLMDKHVPIALVSKRLGHSTIAITADLYSHLLDEADQGMAEALDGLL